MSVRIGQRFCPAVRYSTKVSSFLFLLPTKNEWGVMDHKSRWHFTFDGAFGGGREESGDDEQQ